MDEVRGSSPLRSTILVVAYTVYHFSDLSAEFGWYHGKSFRPARVKGFFIYLVFAGGLVDPVGLPVSLAILSAMLVLTKHFKQDAASGLVTRRPGGALARLASGCLLKHAFASGLTVLFLRNKCLALACCLL